MSVLYVSNIPPLEFETGGESVKRVGSTNVGANLRFARRSSILIERAYLPAGTGSAFSDVYSLPLTHPLRAIERARRHPQRLCSGQDRRGTGAMLEAETKRQKPR